MIPSDEEIYYFLFGDSFIINQLYKSPLSKRRGKIDTVASFTIHDRVGDGIIRWKDFGLPDGSVSGNKAINLLMELKGLSYRQAQSYATHKIKPQMRGVEIKLERAQTFTATPYVKYDSNYTNSELEYWNDYGIEPDDLLREDVYGLRSLQWGDNPICLRSNLDVPVFIYIFNDNPIAWKIYIPGDEFRDKDFKTWNISSVIEGLSFMDGELPCVITASTKDRLCFKKAKPDWTSVNGTNENVYFPFIEQKELIEQTPYQVILFDADEPGFNGSSVLSQKTGWDFIDMRNKLDGQKDISDYAKKFGIGALTDKLNSLL